ncbi:HAMP domain-containing sensor histidine kinase [Nonomuraea longicatena]|uniref:sensor histidine kinase n=1 Tax=Nonomuraea longicatena TaxID=83682 RepID=UPI0031E29D7E
MKVGKSLRTRLTLLVTVAVALAVALSAGLSFSLARAQMYRQVDEEIVPHPNRTVQEQRSAVSYLLKKCSSNPKDRPPYTTPSSTQVVYADGRPPCVVGSQLKVKPEDLRIAREGGSRICDGHAVDGTPVRIWVENVAPGMAVMDGRAVNRLQDSLQNFAILLVAIAGLGVLLAAWAGLIVARTALRPVGRLTTAVEHIATTQDLDTTIPVNGTDEIARLSASFNAMMAALAGSRDRQRRLVADAGHELRTPLTTLRTNIGLLLRSEQIGRQIDPKAKERLLVNIRAQFAELTTLVGDLLQLARGDTDHEPQVPLALHELVTAAVDRATLRGAEVVTRLDPWYVVGDGTSLERAVLNLIDNARKFSPEGVEVVLRGGVLTVRDHGPGIEEDELPHVFERFWRSPGARGLPGSGLGLAIVKQAVEKAGGSVTLRNAAGGGAIATMRIPGGPTQPV